MACAEGAQEWKWEGEGGEEGPVFFVGSSIRSGQIDDAEGARLLRSYPAILLWHLRLESFEPFHEEREPCSAAEHVVSLA